MLLIGLFPYTGLLLVLLVYVLVGLHEHPCGLFECLWYCQGELQWQALLAVYFSGQPIWL